MQFEFIVNFEEQFANTCFPLTLIFKFAKKKQSKHRMCMLAIR